MFKNPKEEHKYIFQTKTTKKNIYTKIYNYNMPISLLQFDINSDNKIISNVAEINRNSYDNYNKSLKSEIKIYDNLLTSELIKIINNFCKNVPIYMHHASINPSKIDNLINKNDTNIKYENRWPSYCLNFQRVNLINNNFFLDLFYKNILPHINIENKNNITIDRLYLNTHIMSRPGLIHKDGKNIIEYNKKDTAPTILLYINENWDINYDSSTCFMIDDNNDKDIHHVEVKCGRIVVFPSYISHKQCDTSSYSYRNNSLRFVIAYHLMYNQTIDKYYHILGSSGK